MKQKTKRRILEVIIVTALSRVVYRLVETGNTVRDLIFFILIMSILAVTEVIIEFYIKTKK